MLGWICLDCGDVVLAFTSQKKPAMGGDFADAVAAGDDKSLTYVWDSMTELKHKTSWQKEAGEPYGS